MYVLITYDVATSTPGGERRLRQVARACMDYGQRVQYSVFECKVDPAQFIQLKARLFSIVDAGADSLRFYHLGANPARKVETHGVQRAYDLEAPLILE